MKYQIPQEVLQALVNILGELPSNRVRGVLNAVETECAAQDKEQAAKTAVDARAAMKAELAAELTPEAGDKP